MKEKEIKHKQKERHEPVVEIAKGCTKYICYVVQQTQHLGPKYRSPLTNVDHKF